MSKRFEGTIALITGGSSGIGLATAQQSVVEGTDVNITGRRHAELEIASSCEDLAGNRQAAW